MAEKKPDTTYDVSHCRLHIFGGRQAVGIEFTTTENETILFGMSGEGLLALYKVIEIAVEKHPEIREWSSVPLN